MKEDRIKALGERFKVEPEEAEGKIRKTYYIDKALSDEVDQTYRRLNYELGGIAKSDFLEVLIRFGLENIETIEKRLRK